MESTRGLENIAEIATLDGIDGIFIGQTDLAVLACEGYRLAEKPRQPMTR